MTESNTDIGAEEPCANGCGASCPNLVDLNSHYCPPVVGVESDGHDVVSIKVSVVSDGDE